jgi:D-3-phosphoglycerate dehydrogenase
MDHCLSSSSTQGAATSAPPLHHRVVAVDDGYAAYDQEAALLNAAGADFQLRPCAGDARAVAAAAHDADVVLVRESPLSREVIQALPRLRAIVRYGVGVDNVDLAAARERGIVVANVPDYGIDEVSSQAVALALAVARRLKEHDAGVRAGRWSAGVLKPMYRWRGRTLGLVGYGRIARMTEEKLLGFGFGRVLVHDPHAELPHRVQAADLDTLFAQCDLVSLHAPLNAHTRHLVNARRLALMPRGAILVNTARGALVDLDALHAAMAAGQLLGAGLDVFDPEPPDPSHPLFALDNVIVTNHVGWYSEESMRELQRKAAEEAARVLRGERPRHWVNPW